MNLEKRYLTLSEFVELQDSLNQIINPMWKQVRKPEDFVTQIIAEMGEFLESGVRYKWWKKQNPENYSYHNAKLELIDVIHFALSIGALFDSNGEGRIKPADAPPLVDDEACLNHAMFVWLVESYLRIHEAYNPSDQLSYAIGLTLGIMDISLEELSALYLLKHQLNIYRQTEGYGDGRYIKMKDGVEDNDLLEPLIQVFMNEENLTLKDLKSMFEEEFVVNS